LIGIKTKPQNVCLQGVQPLNTQSGFLSGKTLGKYQVLERIGVGGMAEVYRGKHERLDRQVAIKILHPALTEETEFVSRFEREARLVANLRHPNIVQMYDFDSQDDQVFMVMEYIPGVTLKQRLQTLKTDGVFMCLDEVSGILKQISSALDYAHSQKMLHRDLKPSNIMITDDHIVYLTDFGIAHILGGTRLTSTSSLLGTPVYMSPEQGRNDPLTNASDLYALAVVLFEMVAGEVPFDADTPISVLQKHINTPPPQLEYYRKDLPRGTGKVLHKALSKNPSDRYSSAEELYHAFITAAKMPLSDNGGTDTILTNSKTHEVENPIFNGNKWLIAGLILILLLVIAGSVLWAARTSAANTIRRCSTPESCQLVAEKLVDANRFSLASEAIEQGIALVPEAEQPTWARLKCDQGDIYKELGNKQAARIAYRDCIAWTKNDPRHQQIRDYA
jgi:serine/threonine protein kinase